MRGAPADRCRLPPALWRAVDAMGIPPAALLRQARLPASLHTTGQSFVTTAQYFALMRALEDLSGDPALGVRMIERAEISAHPPSSIAAFYARDYRDGVTRLARFKRLCTPELLNISEADDSCTVTMEWLYATDVEPAISVDITFATLIELGRRGSGRPIAPRRVEFARAGPKSAYHRTYFGVSVQYGGKRNALVLDRSDLDRPFSGHNPEMLDILTPALGTALQELDAQPTTGEQVRAVLKRSLPSGRPDITDVARDLGMSERTLQRRITEEGTSFRDLLADARQDLARSLLSDQSAQMDEVAYLLGYQDTSSFYRAFRDWEGMSPRRWRDQRGPDAAP